LQPSYFPADHDRSGERPLPHQFPDGGIGDADLVEHIALGQEPCAGTDDDVIRGQLLNGDVHAATSAFVARRSAFFCSRCAMRLKTHSWISLSTQPTEARLLSATGWGNSPRRLKAA